MKQKTLQTKTLQTKEGRQDMNYALDEDGLRLLMDGGTAVTIPSDGSLGILMDTDDRRGRRFGTIIKHGEAGVVMQAFRRHWSVLQRAVPTLEGLAAAEAFAAITGLAQGQPAANREILRGIAADLEYVEIQVSMLTADMVEEINACLATTGRAGKLKERLHALADCSVPVPGFG